MFIAHDVTGFFWPPMHQREVLAAGGGTRTDTMHIATCIREFERKIETIDY
jgi:hypothetical protein